MRALTQALELYIRAKWPEIQSLEKTILASALSRLSLMLSVKFKVVDLPSTIDFPKDLLVWSRIVAEDFSTIFSCSSSGSLTVGGQRDIGRWKPNRLKISMIDSEIIQLGKLEWVKHVRQRRLVYPCIRNDGSGGINLPNNNHVFWSRRPVLLAWSDRLAHQIFPHRSFYPADRIPGKKRSLLQPKQTGCKPERNICEHSWMKSFLYPGWISRKNQQLFLITPVSRWWLMHVPNRRKNNRTSWKGERNSHQTQKRARNCLMPGSCFLCSALNFEIIPISSSRLCWDENYWIRICCIKDS